MNARLPDGELLVRGDEKEVVRHVLTGKQGYTLVERLKLLRVWDEKATYLVHLDELISLKLSHEQRSK